MHLWYKIYNYKSIERVCSKLRNIDFARKLLNNNARFILESLRSIDFLYERRRERIRSHKKMCFIWCLFSVHPRTFMAPSRIYIYIFSKHTHISTKINIRFKKYTKKMNGKGAILVAKFKRVMFIYDKPIKFIVTTESAILCIVWLHEQRLLPANLGVFLLLLFCFVLCCFPLPFYHFVFVCSFFSIFPFFSYVTF